MVEHEANRRNISGVIPTRSALKIYYALRKTNVEGGLTDGAYPRYHNPIGTREQIEDITPGRLASCMLEEIDLFRINQNNQRHRIEALEREKSILAEMVSRANEVYGISREKLIPHRTPK